MDTRETIEYWITWIILKLKIDYDINAYLLWGLAAIVIGFILFKDKKLRFPKLNSIAIISAIIFLVILSFFIYNWDKIDKAPPKTELLIPDFPGGTFGFRAWGTKIELSNINVSKIGTNDKLFGSSVKWAKVWYEGYPQLSNDRFSKINNNNEIILKNCGIIYASKLNDYKFLKIEADIKILEIETDVDWPSFQFCFRVPIVKKSHNDIQQILTVPGHSDKYIALEVHPQKIWYSKCWLPESNDRPKHEDDFYQRFLGILNKGIYRIKAGESYRFIAEIKENGSVLLKLLTSNKIAIPIYEGKLDSGKK